MRGSVSQLHALISVPLLAPAERFIEIEFVIDTGFAGFLTLPEVAVAALQLPFDRYLYASLADGSEVLVAVHTATIEWHSVHRKVDVIATGKRPLLGTSLLDGCEVCIKFADGGALIVEPLASSNG